MFIFLPAATCYPLRRSWKTRPARGWSDMSDPAWGLAPLSELQPCQEPIIHIHPTFIHPEMEFVPINVGVFYQIEYLHTKLCSWCQAGSASLSPGTQGVCLSGRGGPVELRKRCPTFPRGLFGNIYHNTSQCRSLLAKIFRGKAWRPGVLREGRKGLSNGLQPSQMFAHLFAEPSLFCLLIGLEMPRGRVKAN